MQVKLGNGDDAGYNTTQHILQQTSTSHKSHENGGGNYARLQIDEVSKLNICYL